MNCTTVLQTGTVSASETERLVFDWEDESFHF